MTTPNDPNDWSALGAEWRTATAEGDSGFHDPNLDVSAVRERAAKFATTIRRRNLREIAAGVVVIVLGIRDVVVLDALLLRIAGALMALGAAWVIAVLVSRGNNRPGPAADAPTREVLVHERSELERQARILEKVWLWYLMPFAPTIVLRFVHGLRDGESVPMQLAALALTLAVFAGVHWLNRRAANKLRARIAGIGDA